MEGRRPRSRTGSRCLVATVIALGAVAVAPATADHGEADVPWPQMLPPAPTDADVQPHPVRNCRRASIACVEGLVTRLRRPWRGYDRSCDHRAVISYSYLQITKGLRDDLARPRPGLVRYRRWMTYVIAAFSNRYFAAFRNDDAGLRVPDAWRVTFETADRGDANAGQDVLLFSNAHVQHDLPFIYEEMGARAPSGAPRKRDHDAVNAINSRVFDPIQDYVAEHYDPSFELLDLKPLPLEEIGVLELVKAWRELAWRNGERLLAARTPQERARVVESIRANSRVWAELISSGEMPGHREVRDAWCEEHHETAG